MKFHLSTNTTNALIRESFNTSFQDSELRLKMLERFYSKNELEKVKKEKLKKINIRIISEVINALGDGLYGYTIPTIDFKKSHPYNTRHWRIIVYFLKFGEKIIVATTYKGKNKATLDNYRSTYKPYFEKKEQEKLVII